jgi:hypothetical protein
VRQALRHLEQFPETGAYWNERWLSVLAAEGRIHKGPPPSRRLPWRRPAATGGGVCRESGAGETPARQPAGRRRSTDTSPVRRRGTPRTALPINSPMSILKVSRLGHPVLREKASDIEVKDIKAAKFKQLIEAMVETMHGGTQRFGVRRQSPPLSNSVPSARQACEYESGGDCLRTP